jgi:hypothetical protein
MDCEFDDGFEVSEGSVGAASPLAEGETLLF